MCCFCQGLVVQHSDDLHHKEAKLSQQASWQLKVKRWTLTAGMLHDFHS